MTATSVLSQQDFPRLILIDGDTLVAFEPEQVTKMNVVILSLDECREIQQSLEEENDLLLEKTTNLESQKENLKEQSETMSKINTEKTEQVNILTDENKKKDKRIKLLKKSRTLFVLGGILVGSATTYVITLLLK